MEENFDVEDNFAVEQQFSGNSAAGASNDAIREMGDVTVSPVHIRRNKYTRRRSRRKTGRARMVRRPDEQEAADRMKAKVFTKWANAHLAKHRKALKIDDITKDLCDGRILCYLLAVLSGKKLKPPNQKKQLKNPASKKVKSLENLRTAFDFIQNEQGIDLHNLITPTNIYNGDVRETLELIWTLILRLEIRSFSKDGLKGQQCMLVWAQRITKAYDHPDVVVKNFDHSWKSGLPFIAILSHYRPDVIDFKKYSNASSKDACEAAFAAAESIGIERILDVEDLVDVVPEESVVMTYIAKFYATFADHAKWENRKLLDPEDNSTKVIADAVLTINHASRQETLSGRWINASVFACLKGAQTWHAAFDDKGALTGTESVPFSLAKDEDVIGWTRAHREIWAPNDDADTESDSESTTTADSSVKALVQENEALKKKVQELEQSAKLLEQKAKEFGQEAKVFERKAKDAEQKVKELEQKAKDATSNKGDLDGKSAENEILRNQVKQLSKQLKDKKNDTAALEREYKKLKTDHKDISAYANEVAGEKAKLEGDITRLEAKLKGGDKQSNEVTKLEMALAAAEKDRDDAKRQVSALTVRLSQSEASKETKSAPGDQMNGSKQKDIEKMTNEVTKLQMSVAVAESQRDQQVEHVKRLILEKKQLTETLEKTINKMILEPVEGGPDPKTQPHLHAIHSRMAHLFDRVTKVDEMMNNVEVYRSHHAERTRKLTAEIKTLEQKLEEVKSMKSKSGNGGGGVKVKKRLDVYSSYLQRMYGMTPVH